MSNEAVVQQQVRLAFATHVNGGQLWRNQSGAMMDENGRLVRFGLANDSAQLNKVIKSSDLIGITPVIIQQHHVGQVFGVFTALECKPSGWHQIPSDKRAAAQAAYHDLVRQAGGMGGFVSSVDDIWGIIGSPGRKP